MLVSGTCRKTASPLLPLLLGTISDKPTTTLRPTFMSPIGAGLTAGWGIPHGPPNPRNPASYTTVPVATGGLEPRPVTRREHLSARRFKGNVYLDPRTKATK